MWEEDDRRRRLRLLEAAGMAQASQTVLDVAAIAGELDVPEDTIRMDLEQLDALGLVLNGPDEGLPPMLLTAGRQFLANGGHAEYEVISFLPRVIDDLNAREALLVAGATLVEEFRAALVDGDPVDHARGLVPRAFTTAVDGRLALDLFAASVALMARLSNGAPAGCVAEVIIAVGVIEEARVWLELRREEGRLDKDQERAASEELYGRAMVVIAAEQHASRLVVAGSQRTPASRWPSHKDHAAKALRKLAGPHVPPVLTQLERAVKRAHDEYEQALVASRPSGPETGDGQ